MNENRRSFDNVLYYAQLVAAQRIQRKRRNIIAALRDRFKEYEEAKEEYLRTFRTLVLLTKHAIEYNAIKRASQSTINAEVQVDAIAEKLKTTADRLPYKEEVFLCRKSVEELSTVLENSKCNLQSNEIGKLKMCVKTLKFLNNFGIPSCQVLMRENIQSVIDICYNVVEPISDSEDSD